MGERARGRSFRGERRVGPSPDTQTLESSLPLHPGLAIRSCVALTMLLKLSILQCPDLKMEVTNQ